MAAPRISILSYLRLNDIRELAVQKIQGPYLGQSTWSGQQHCSHPLSLPQMRTSLAFALALALSQAAEAQVATVRFWALTIYSETG